MPIASETKSTTRPPFIFIGEHPALDFANTLAVEDGKPLELLRSWSDVIAWLAEAKLSTDTSLQLLTARASEALVSVIELRRAWEKALSQLVDGGKISEAFLERLNALLAHDSFHETLHREGKQGFHLARSTSRLEGSQLALAILARQIADFLVDANLDHLHRCANTTSCVLYFYDTTKNHRRQWCSVATCGNRHKVAQFRKRAAQKDA